MNTTTPSMMQVTGTKAALTKLANRVGVTVTESPRTGALLVVFPCRNPDLSLWADARSNGEVCYFNVKEDRHVIAPTQGVFVGACQGLAPAGHVNVQRHSYINHSGVICLIS